MVEGDAVASIAALMTAINTSNADVAGLNGALEVLDEEDAGIGAIVLTAAVAGLAGAFTVTDAEIDTAAVAEQSTLTFSTDDADYFAGGKLYVTIGGVAIEAEMVDGNAAGSIAALVTAINTSNADVAGLNGVLEVLTEDDVYAETGAITLTAAVAGLAGAFTVTDAEIDTPAGVAAQEIEETVPAEDADAASDSAPGYGGVPHTIDTITGFNLGVDKLDLSGGTDLLSDGDYTTVASNTITITDGLVTDYSGSDGNLLIGELLYLFESEKKTAAFEIADGYAVVQGDGVEGGQISDIVVYLVGTTGDPLTDLGDILV
jgi:hypothetical protein